MSLAGFTPHTHKRDIIIMFKFKIFCFAVFTIILPLAVIILQMNKTLSELAQFKAIFG
jgi:hypothetical protein